MCNLYEHEKGILFEKKCSSGQRSLFFWDHFTLTYNRDIRMIA